MVMLSESPNIQWFEVFPKCRCGKVAHGILRGTRNESYGYHCKACANKRIKASERVRAAKTPHPFRSSHVSLEQ